MSKAMGLIKLPYLNLIFIGITEASAFEGVVL